MEHSPISEETKQFISDVFTRFQCLRKNNQNLKLKISLFEPEKEKTNENVRAQRQEDQQEEAVDDLVSDNLYTETLAMDEDIDIKEEEVGIEQAKSKSDGVNSIYHPLLLGSGNADQSAQSVMKNDIDDDESVLTVLRSANQVTNTEPPAERSGMEVGNNHDLNYTSSSYLTNNLVCPTLSATTLQVDHKGRSAKRKLNLTVDNETDVNLVGRSKRQRKVESEVEVCNAKEMPIVGEGNDPPSVDETNPLKKEKIMGIILSNLGKHDLLNARLVSHAWNGESLKVLRKSKFTQVLTEWNIEEYLLFTTNRSKPNPLIIPFHLKFSIDLSSMCFDMYNPIILSSHVKSLCQTFGLHCVSTLTLSTCHTDRTEEDIEGIDLREIFTLISQGLKTLDLSNSNLRNDFLKSQIIQLPNLKKLVCNTSRCKSGKSGPEVTYISMIENSPNLDDLTLTWPCDLKSWPLKFNQLKSLSLYPPSNPQNILDKILASSGRLVVLRELNLEFNMSLKTQNYIVVYNILKSLSPTLKSLKFRTRSLLLFSWQGYSGYIRTMRFPKLPHLEHLGLEYRLGHKYWISHEAIDMRHETFPSLKSIELPIGFIFSSSILQTQEYQEKDDNRVKFPNLVKLILRVNDIAGQGVDELKRSLEHLQNIFPTPSKLSLVNVGCSNDCVQQLLRLIMMSNWSKNIQEIEMIGFTQDYFGQVLKFLFTLGSINFTPMNHINVKMINITTIKLEYTKGIDGFYHDRDTPHSTSKAPMSIQNLTTFVKHFPKLRMIEVSGLFFHQSDKRMWRKYSLEFKSKYPDIVLNIT